MANHVWTDSNTEGFTSGELDILNTAQEHLEAAHAGVDPRNIADILNNVWVAGADAETLERNAELHLDTTDPR